MFISRNSVSVILDNQLYRPSTVFKAAISVVECRDVHDNLSRRLNVRGLASRHHSVKPIITRRLCFHLRPTVFWLVIHETWMDDGSRSRIDPINFWCVSG